MPDCRAPTRSALISATTTRMSGQCFAITAIVGPPTYPAPMQRIFLIIARFRVAPSIPILSEAGSGPRDPRVSGDMGVEEGAYCPPHSAGQPSEDTSRELHLPTRVGGRSRFSRRAPVPQNGAIRRQVLLEVDQ